MEAIKEVFTPGTLIKVTKRGNLYHGRAGTVVSVVEVVGYTFVRVRIDGDHDWTHAFFPDELERME